MSAVSQARPGSGAPADEGLPEFSLSSPRGSVATRGRVTPVAEDAWLGLARERGTGVVGMIPFDPAEPARLGVPHAWTRTGGPASALPSPLRAIPRPWSIRGADSPAYREAVSRAVAAVHAGTLEKIVLSRLLELEYDADSPLSAEAVHRNLLSQHAAAHVFSVRGDGDEHHMGASPELVVGVRDGVLWTHPLAGSAPRPPGADATEDTQAGERLMRSAKDRSEHAAVVTDIAARLEPLCEELTVPAVPTLLATPQLWHLGTPMTGRVRPGVTALDAARAIHPTPAICGVPRGEALRSIAELEGAPRGFFGGLVGWTDPRGDGDWVLNLRSARVGPRAATLFAGAGVVAGSTARGEHRETGVKLSTFLAVLGLAPVDLPGLID
ncbi:isochorismate synthase [Rothia sp. AR01]|uniref:isochorismate synthase n=1 Tax=Rothia santali TaxID=2949643 RepID=A0A9X2KLM1_9MICC|nr:isochorismate synthase [Rothia santali]MCP3426311.1 isochorismate synthase [Rothia santali]